MGRIGIERGIASQFWNIQESEPINFKLDVEIVKEFPKKIYEKAEKLICWAFMAQEKPVLVGFPRTGGEVKVRVAKCYAIVNKLGVPEELLIHDRVRSYKLIPNESVHDFLAMINILKFDGQLYFDSESFTNLIYSEAEKAGFVDEEGWRKDFQERWKKA